MRALRTPSRSPRRFAAWICAAGALGLAGAATAQAETVVAIGTGQFAVTPGNPKSNASIKAAVRAAEREAIPRAITNARLQAALIASAAGLTVGAITAVEQQAPSPYGPYFFSRFGPNQYCGNVTRGIVRKDATGRRRVVRRVTRRVCSAPEYAVMSVMVTFSAAPGPIVVTAR